jgi:transposase-like protein
MRSLTQCAARRVAVYPIVYFDCLMVKVREDRSVRARACYLAVGVTVEGGRDVLGIWWQETEGAKFWLAVLNDLHRRGVGDVLVACVDGLRASRRRSRRSSRRRGCRPASSTRSGPRCATSPTATARPSRAF